MKSRKWIKGHFYAGVFYGLVMGGIIFTIFWNTSAFLAAAVTIFSYLITRKLEAQEFKQ